MQKVNEMFACLSNTKYKVDGITNYNKGRTVELDCRFQ